MQVIEETEHKGNTVFKPLFASETILVRKEEIAFPVDSLVADCGGILGLFLGFNFLMVWEWIIYFILLCYNRNLSNK